MEAEMVNFPNTATNGEKNFMYLSIILNSCDPVSEWGGLMCEYNCVSAGEIYNKNHASSGL